MTTTDPFTTLRPRLFGIAYRMLGVRADAEDVLQDAWLRWSRTDASVSGGAHTLDWDGVTSAGQQLPDGGSYTLKITATGSGGEAINASSHISGIVSGVETVSGGTVVSIGKLKIPVSSVTSVQSAS